MYSNFFSINTAVANLSTGKLITTGYTSFIIIFIIIIIIIIIM